MWVLSVVYVVKLRVETGIIDSDDQLVFTPIAGQVIKSFAEVAYLVGFIIWVVYERHLMFLFGGRFQ